MRSITRQSLALISLATATQMPITWITCWLNWLPREFLRTVLPRRRTEPEGLWGGRGHGTTGQEVGRVKVEVGAMPSQLPVSPPVLPPPPIPPSPRLGGAVRMNKVVGVIHKPHPTQRGRGMRAILSLFPWSFRCWEGRDPPHPPKQGARAAHLGYGHSLSWPCEAGGSWLSRFLAASTLLRERSFCFSLLRWR